MATPNLKPLVAPAAPKPVGPYSCALEHEDTVYVSGQLPIDAEGNVPEDVAAQAQQSLNNIKALLAEAGLGMANVVKTTVFLTNIDDFATVNEVYGSMFSQPFPARSCFEVSKLPKGAKVEIECIAVRK